MIVPMARVEVVGPRDAFLESLEFLQSRGVLELHAAAGLEPRGPAASPGPEPSAAPLEDALRRVDALLARLPSTRGAAAEPLPPPGTEAFAARVASIETELSTLEARRAALVRERDATKLLARLVVQLAPLGAGLDPALEPEVHGLFLRTDVAEIPLLESEVQRLTNGACEVKARALDDETTGVLVVVPRALGPAVSKLLAERGVDETTLDGRYSGKGLTAVLLQLAARERSLPGEIARAEVALGQLASTAGRALRDARTAAAGALERHRAVAACGETRFAFVISGYMPEDAVPALRDAAAKALPRASVFARAPSRAEWPEMPVVLRNSALVRPFQILLGLVPLPRYGSIDPTPWLAVFFPLLFGLILGDAAFGALGTVVSLVAWRAGWGGATGRDVAKVALWCSLSAGAFGVLYGEALGELGAHVGLRPLLLHRRGALLSFLGVALAIGAAHVTIGMGLGVAAAVRARRVREACARVAKLLLLLAAVVAAASLAGVVPGAALLPAGIACGALLATAVALEGPLALLDAVLALGNVLSYARLMALGLASVMLAEVANRVAATLEPAAVGLALGVLLHAVNFSLGLVSPVIAALRLQYVEFFEKFYDAGGRAYAPFALPR